DRADRRHFCDRAQEIDESGQIIRSHIERRSAACREEKSRIGMPVLHPRSQHRCAPAHCLADLARIDDLAGELMRGEDGRVRSAGDGELTLRSEFDDLFHLREGYAEGFLAIDVLASEESLPR